MIAKFRICGRNKLRPEAQRGESAAGKLAKMFQASVILGEAVDSHHLAEHFQCGWELGFEELIQGRRVKHGGRVKFWPLSQRSRGSGAS